MIEFSLLSNEGYMCGVGGGDSTADMHDDKNMSPEKKKTVTYVTLVWRQL